MPQQSQDSPHWGFGTGLTTEVMLDVVLFILTVGGLCQRAMRKQLGQVKKHAWLN